MMESSTVFLEFVEWEAHRVNVTLVNSSVHNEILQSLTTALWLYVSPVLLVIGCLGNVFSLVVLNSATMRQSRCTFTLGALAITDTSVLLIALCRSWWIKLIPLDIRSTSDVVCKIHTFLSYFIRHLSSWTVALVAAERAVSVCNPLKAKQWCNKTRITIAWSMIVALLVVINAPVLWLKKLGYDSFNNESYCHFPEPKLNQISWWMDFAMLCAIPIVVILPCNLLIIIKMNCHRMNARGSWRATTTALNRSRLSSMTVMLLLVCVVFVITTIPITFYFIRRGTTTIAEGDQDLTWLIYTICNLIYYTNNAVNFFLYCLGGTAFRKAALAVLCHQEPKVHRVPTQGDNTRLRPMSLTNVSLLTVPVATKLTPVSSEDCAEYAPNADSAKCVLNRSETEIEI